VLAVGWVMLQEQNTSRLHARERLEVSGAARVGDTQRWDVGSPRSRTLACAERRLPGEKVFFFFLPFFVPSLFVSCWEGKVRGCRSRSGRVASILSAEDHGDDHPRILVVAEFAGGGRKDNDCQQSRHRPCRDGQQGSGARTGTLRRTKLTRSSINQRLGFERDVLRERRFDRTNSVSVW